MKTIFDIAKRTKKYKKPDKNELGKLKKHVLAYQTELSTALHAFYESQNLDEEIYTMLFVFDKSLAIKERLHVPAQRAYHNAFSIRYETLTNLAQGKFHYALSHAKKMYAHIQDFLSVLEKRIDIALLNNTAPPVRVGELEFLVLNDQNPKKTECRKFDDYGDWDIIDSNIRELSQNGIILNYSNPLFLTYNESIQSYEQGMIVEDEIKQRILSALELNKEKHCLEELGKSHTYRADVYDNTFFAGFKTKKDEYDVILSVHKHNRGVALDVYLIMDLDAFNAHIT